MPPLGVLLRSLPTIRRHVFADGHGIVGRSRRRLVRASAEHANVLSHRSYRRSASRAQGILPAAHVSICGIADKETRRAGWRCKLRAERVAGFLEQTTRDVVESFRSCTSRQLDKFDKDKADDRSAKMSAVVTKHPAAFFAKEAAKLCTADNVLMWQEARLAHLVVFDLAHRSFQGIALLYVKSCHRFTPRGQCW